MKVLWQGNFIRIDQQIDTVGDRVRTVASLGGPDKIALSEDEWHDLKDAMEHLS